MTLMAILGASLMSGILFIVAAGTLHGQAPVPPEHLWQFLVTLLGPTGASAFALWGWTKWLQARGKLPGQWEEAKFFAALQQMHEKHRTDMSQDMRHALTMAVKEVQLLLAEDRAKRDDRRMGS